MATLGFGFFFFSLHISTLYFSSYLQLYLDSVNVQDFILQERRSEGRVSDTSSSCNRLHVLFPPLKFQLGLRCGCPTLWSDASLDSLFLPPSIPPPPQPCSHRVPASILHAHSAALWPRLMKLGRINPLCPPRLSPSLHLGETLL